MSQLETKKIEAALLKKGFKVEETHHSMYWFHIGDKKTSIRTRISHGEKEYGDFLLGQMAKQLKIKKNELDELVECTLSKEQYEKLLTEREHVQTSPVSVEKKQAENKNSKHSSKHRRNK